MKLGLWNIDHPETETGSRTKQRRFDSIKQYLLDTDCGIYILAEANAALELPGYFNQFSVISPYRNRSRCYATPNIYHQVAVYSKWPLKQHEIAEPINGLLCEVTDIDLVQWIYGSVVTIKDRWSQIKSKKYSDRLTEQISQIGKLGKSRTLIGGDFNLKYGWQQKKSAFERLKLTAGTHGWCWPTSQQTETVQHVLHSKELKSEIAIDKSVVRSEGTVGLSDHPFVQVRLS